MWSPRGIILLATALLLSPVRAEDPERHLVMMTNGQVEVGILLAAGGRAVILRRPGGANLLAGDPTLWNPETIPAQDALRTFVDLGGQMIWVAPQNGWWAQQQVTDQYAPMWPPDPTLVFGRAAILARTATSLSVQLPPSPFCGLQLTKSYTLDGDSVAVSVTATNIRATPVHWDLWSNIHPRPDATVWAPWPAGAKLHLEHDSEHPGTDGPPSLVPVDELVACPPSDPTDVRRNRVGKFFLTGPISWLAASGDGWAFLVGFPQITDPAPGHAPVEIYIEHRPGLSAVELEHHSSFRTLASGEHLELTERWTVLDLPPGESREAVARRLAAIAPAAVPILPSE